MSKKHATPAAETKPVYTGPLGLHPVSDTAYEVKVEGRDMGNFLEYFAHDVFADCDTSEVVCRNFDETPATNLQPGDIIGFSTPDGETAVPFRFGASPRAGWHFDPAQGRDIRTIYRIAKLYAPPAQDPTPTP